MQDKYFCASCASGRGIKNTPTKNSPSPFFSPNQKEIPFCEAQRPSLCATLLSVPYDLNLFTSNTIPAAPLLVVPVNVEDGLFFLMLIFQAFLYNILIV